MSDIRLKPCPFCGSLEVESYREAYMNIEGEEGSAYSVRCSKCGASGPEKPDEVSAATAWNCRSLDWISTAERMPDENEKLKPLVLVTSGGSGDLPYAGTGVWHNGRWGTADPELEFEPITYWMELPDIPEEAWK